MTIQMKASEQNFPMVLPIMLYKVILTLKFAVKSKERFVWRVNKMTDL